MTNISRVIMLTANYWNGIEYQRHHLTRHFLKRGIPVYFVERLPQRMPRLGFKDISQWFKMQGYGNADVKKSIPEGLTVISYRSLPPTRWLRFINILLTRRALSPYLKDLGKENTILISYVPSYTHIDIAALVNPRKTIYIGVHNYDADSSMPDLLLSESEIVNSRIVLAGDSIYNVERLRRISKGAKNVNQLAPGVDYALFKSIDTGRPVSYRRLYYFGGIGPHLDINLYNALSASLEITFVGVVDARVRKLISPRIRLRPPVSGNNLPEILKGADILGIFYKKSPYIDAVIPAKFFECLATGRPLLVSGMEESRMYSEVVYECASDLSLTLRIIEDLPKTETDHKLALRDRIARCADWENRFNCLVSMLDSN